MDWAKHFAWLFSWGLSVVALGAGFCACGGVCATMGAGWRVNIGWRTGRECDGSKLTRSRLYGTTNIRSYMTDSLRQTDRQTFGKGRSPSTHSISMDRFEESYRTYAGTPGSSTSHRKSGVGRTLTRTTPTGTPEYYTYESVE